MKEQPSKKEKTVNIGNLDDEENDGWLHKTRQEKKDDAQPNQQGRTPTPN